MRRDSSSVFPELLVETPRVKELLVLERYDLAPGHLFLDLLLNGLEFLVALGQDANDRAAHGLVVGSLCEVSVVLELPAEHPGQVEDSVGRSLHWVFLWESSSESGCRKSCSKTLGGTAATSAPISAASRTWTGFVKLDTKICVWNP